MSVPTHGPWCQTWMYPANCKSCGDPIHVFQCTCNSAVLFDTIYPDWDKHDCRFSSSGGIGGSGYSGWMAVDVLESSGIKITPEIMGKVFPSGKSDPSKSAPSPIQRIEPAINNAQESVIAVVREIHQETKLTKQLHELEILGQKLIGLDSVKSWSQITLITNNETPNRSFTCIVTDNLGVQASSMKDQIAFVNLEAQVVGEVAIWLVNDLHIL